MSLGNTGRPVRHPARDVHSCCSDTRSCDRLPFLFLQFIFLFALATGLAGTAQADPVYEGPLLFGLDPVIKTTEDPRLLGVDRLVLRRRLADLGIDPIRHPERRPGLESLFRRHVRFRVNIDLERQEHFTEYNGTMGLMTEFQYPSFFFLFPSPETLPGGFLYYPPRPTGDPVVRIFVDDLGAGVGRRQAVGRVFVRSESLDVAGKGRRGAQDGSLINLTIPIKLPRTLEKIIGRGEKTKIKITGRERIAISGESTVVNPFTPNERVSSQSLFPTLDMEQELQVSLSGTIGEKIIVAVDHNSAQVGPDATRIKLMYQGLEDEIIRTIETGDVGLTLPGSQLLGYSSNKSGLFGIKVTGQVGPTDFTVVASKQKAETSSKTFNATGGQVSDNIINSSDYLNHRFFRLDLPEKEFPDGRVQGDEILLETIKIFQLLPGQPIGADIVNVATYVDSLGFSNWGNMDFNEPILFGRRWKEIEGWDPLRDADEKLIAVDLRTQMSDEDALAVIYEIKLADGSIVQVGDIPGQDVPQQTVTGGEGLYYRMKLLKAPVSYQERYTFQYVLRNVYSLGGSTIDDRTFDLRIERNVPGANQPQQDESGIDYIRIFGLDRDDPQLSGNPDGLVDMWDPYLIDLTKGLLKFPLDFPMPFAPGGNPLGRPDDADAIAEAAYSANADTSAFIWDPSFLRDNQTWQLYDPSIYPSQFSQFTSFRIIATHASAASSFNLGVSNIEEGSETVNLDGRTLTRGVDYEIDYTFGEVKLIGEAANLNSDSKINVNYQFSPFFGGGNTSLMGFNLGYDLGSSSSLSTTWLYETENIVGEKAKLGEEPSKNLVGNLSLSHTFKPYFLTHVANFVSRRNTERPSSLQVSGETAVSLPNPNTKGKVFLEDFEGVDSSDVVSLTRIAWSWASAPFLGSGYLAANPGDSRTFDPEDRVETVRWFLPKERALRRYLNPELINQERDETQPSMNMFLRADDGSWDPEDWGGIMRSISRTGLDLSKAQFIEIWINDGVPDIDQRRGKLHMDFGYINEDGFWPVDVNDNLELGTRQREDGIVDGIPDDVFFAPDEDIGLDGNEFGPQKFDANFEVNGDSPYPGINGTARNSREDDEDLNRDDRLNVDNGYFTATIDLKDTKALVDVVYDYDDVQDLIASNIAWRKYRIPLTAVDSVSVGTAANLRAVTHTRIWFEDADPGGRTALTFELSEFKFLGSRWEREGIRRNDGEKLLTQSQLLPGEEFFLGEVNNKENPDYYPPFPVNEVNNIPEKEQSLVLNFKNIEQGHMVRASKQVSSRGDDYTRYSDLVWYWFNPNHATADLDLFFRVGSDTLNFYEIDYRFSDSPVKTGWHSMNISVAELSNAKNGSIDENGHTHSTVRDRRSGELYHVRVVGRPDLRLVKRYYFGFKNISLSKEASGFFYLNDVLLEGVKRDMGMAQRAGMRLNMADVVKVDFDWRHTDDEFHGLDQRAGSGIDNEDWNLSGNLAVEDFVPLLGFSLPVSGSRRQTVRRPKYETFSDIEIIDEDIRNSLSTIDTQERFSSRLSHSPSKGAILRYLVDPWTLQVSGSRSNLDGPLEQRRSKSLQGSLNFDLRIPGLYTLGAYPLIQYIPIVRGLSIMPRKVAFAGSFTSSFNSSLTIDNNGMITARPTTRSRPGKLSGSFDYQPLQVLDMSVSANSDRDLMRESMWHGVNIGEENRRTYELRMTVLVPKAKGLGTGSSMAPIRALLRGAHTMKPSIQFNGSFADEHGPGTGQAGDPEDVRTVGSAGRWEFRMNVPVGKAFTAVFPEKKYSQSERDRLIAEQRRREQQDLRGGGHQGEQPAAPEPPGSQESKGDEQTGDENFEGLTPEEIQRREQERLLAEAERKLEEDREQGLAQDEEPIVEDKRRINPLAILNPLFNTLRNVTPVQFVYSNQSSSNYSRLLEDAPFWYKTGLVNEIDYPDSLYTGYATDHKENLVLSTTTRIAKTVAFDVKYGESRTRTDRNSSVTRSYKQDWPDAQLSLTGLEKWRIFGGRSKDVDAGWFQSSNFNISYKRSKIVSKITDSSYNPNITRSISPRWTVNFRSGLTSTVNATFNNSESIINGVSALKSTMRLGLQVRHSFNAQTFLAKVGLYRPGSSQSVTMDADLSYTTDRSERINPGMPASKPTGSDRYSLNPRFTYQITKNLSGAVRFIFSRNKNITSGQTSTSLGLGLEATFVF